MKLFLHKNLQHRRELIKFTFDVCQRELGLKDAEGGVRLWAANCDGAAGDTANFIKDGKAHVRLDHGVLGDDAAIVQVLCHEMVHVKQLVKDGMRCVCALPLLERIRYRALHGIVYKGKLYPEGNSPMQYGNIEKVPWEKEAYDKTPQLMAKVSEEWAERHPGVRSFRPIPALGGPESEIRAFLDFLGELIRGGGRR
jgi:hypothetical protein